jgi:hypothetical protein
MIKIFSLWNSLYFWLIHITMYKLKSIIFLNFCYIKSRINRLFILMKIAFIIRILYTEVLITSKS